VAQKNRVHIGLIFGLQSHTSGNYRKVADNDLRSYQWRIDGEDWKGAYTSSGSLEIPENERDYKIPTPSRYASHLRDYNLKRAYDWAVMAKKLMDDYPGVITVINGPIEEELAIGGHHDNSKLADYSPYAITEFRDWLRHTGMYDATTGKYAGESANEFIVGEFINFNGTLRSPFYDDPNPDDNNNTGKSFNEHFGTNFTTWHLRYWDLDVYPPIRNEDFDCTPESGTGFYNGGFDAPRTLLAHNKFWSAWTWDVPDQNGQYPSGNPEAPAFGFRQNMVRNFVRNLMDTVASAGIPREFMYAHQIPGEALGNFTGAWGRLRSSASPVWTGYMEKSSNVGITRFGDIDPSLMTQYADDWGIFEWHTKPNADPQTQGLYDASIAALNRYYENKCHYLFPGWWNRGAPTSESTFPLNDSKFAVAIKDFHESTIEVPYHLQGASKDYTPPKVFGVRGNIDDTNRMNVTWSEKIWEDLLPNWFDWANCEHFEVEWSVNGTDWNRDTTMNYNFSTPVTQNEYQVRVRAVSKSGLKGAWSDINDVTNVKAPVQLSMKAQFDTIFADPNQPNMISIHIDPGDHQIAMSDLSINLFGDGYMLNNEPANRDEIEKFWPMDGAAEVKSLHSLDNVSFSGGVMTATISPDTPIDPYFSFSGSQLNGSELPYITFRMYSSVNSVGSIYWFHEGGLNSTGFSVKEGWNIYRIENLPEWINKSAISNVRLDPINTAHAQMQLDWFALSSKPISETQVPTMAINGNDAEIISYPDGKEGRYTLVASLNDLIDSMNVVTTLTNRTPEVSINKPKADTLIELGSLLSIEAFANDADGDVLKVLLSQNGELIDSIIDPPYILNWEPNHSGDFEINASAFDNASGISVSNSLMVQVVEQSGYPNGEHQVPGVIEAEDYDIGGPGISFFDTDTINQGNYYRDDAVDLDQKGNDNYIVDWTNDGEWLEYSLDVAEALFVNIMVEAAIQNADFHLEINDKQVTSVISVTEEGGLSTFEERWFNDIFLHKGIQKLKLVIDKGDMKIDKIHVLEYAGISYTLIVNKGTGDSSYTEGTIVDIVADAPPQGQIFSVWTGDVTNVADVNAATTTITMPANEVELTATYKVQSFNLTVNSGTGGGSYPESTQVSITANAPPSADSIFYQWTGDVANVADVNDDTTTITMPAAAVELTATYTAISSIDIVRTSSKGSDVKIYPNPANEKLFIEIPENMGMTSVRWMDATGKNLGIETNVHTGVNTISMEGFSEGLYFIKISSEGETKTFKIIKK